MAGNFHSTNFILQRYNLDVGNIFPYRDLKFFRLTSCACFFIVHVSLNHKSCTLIHIGIIVDMIMNFIKYLRSDDN